MAINNRKPLELVLIIGKTSLPHDGEAGQKNGYQGKTDDDQNDELRSRREFGADVGDDKYRSKGNDSYKRFAVRGKYPQLRSTEGQYVKGDGYALG